MFPGHLELQTAQLQLQAPFFTSSVVPHQPLITPEGIHLTALSFTLSSHVLSISPSGDFLGEFIGPGAAELHRNYLPMVL